MRLLQLVQKPQRRGAEIFALALSRELERQGHETRIAYLYPATGLDLRSQDRLLGGNEQDRLETVPGFDPLLLRRLRAEIRSFGPDIIQVNGSRTVKYGSLARRLPAVRCPLIYRSIGNPEDWAGGRLRRHLYRRLIISAIDGVVGVSRLNLERARRFYGLKIPSVHIPRGIDASDLAGATSPQEVFHETLTPEGSPVVLYVGSLSREKRPDRLLRVFKQVAGELPDARLWVLGTGPLRSETEAEATRLGINSQICFLGVRSDVGSYLQAADVLLLTSDTEGMPGVLLEAGCAGRPVVAPKVGGVEECVVEGKTGLLAEPGDEAALAEAVSTLLHHPPLRRTMGKEGRAWTERFSISRVAQQYVDFYLTFLDR